MSSYVFISLSALYFYVFFLVVFLPAKKNRLIVNFMMVLVTMILWTGGSLLMRIQFPPTGSGITYLWPAYGCFPMPISVLSGNSAA